VDESSGRVIVLNGASSSGKTTLAGALQARLAALGECWIVIGVDDYIARLPFDWVIAGDHVGPHGAEGMTLAPVEGGVEVRLGPVGRRLFAAYRAGVAAAARAGMDVIVDEALIGELEWEGWQRELRGLDVLWVRVTADPALMDQRERERGDRVIGLARVQRDVVHRFHEHDVTIDTGVLTTEEATDVILTARGSGDALG
jgi:chloramphenicol 3-O phosphotransferase